ncbi:MAG: hypothetical protein ABR583_07210 [Gaiellaceae bacterium]
MFVLKLPQGRVAFLPSQTFSARSRAENIRLALASDPAGSFTALAEVDSINGEFSMLVLRHESVRWSKKPITGDIDLRPGARSGASSQPHFGVGNVLPFIGLYT